MPFTGRFIHFGQRKAIEFVFKKYRHNAFAMLLKVMVYETFIRTWAGNVNGESTSVFQIDTRLGDFQFGPDGSVPYLCGMQNWMGQLITSSGSTMVNGQIIPRGVQIWTVGTTGTYDIVAGGAAGGGYIYAANSIRGGRGVVVKTQHFFTARQYVAIMVGAKPSGCPTSGMAGGGGGTFISLYSATSSFQSAGAHTLILAAGGGGSVGLSGIQEGVDATTETSGRPCRSNPNTAVATNGGGGGAGALPGGNAADGGSSNGIANGGGGGGFIGSGGSGWTSNFDPGGSAANQQIDGGRSFLRGGSGGVTRGTVVDTSPCVVTGVSSPGPATPAGGYGGGGGGWNAGGGGGGYSGGQGCGISSRQGGGGGGSYDLHGDGNSAELYTTWNSAQFGPKPAGVSPGFNTLAGFAVISACRVGTCVSGDGCEPCRAGKYASMAGSTACSNCDAGTYSTVIGATSASLCRFLNISTGTDMYNDTTPSAQLQFTSAPAVSAGVLCEVVPVIQFKVPYHLSDFTEGLRNNMVLAIANVLVDVSVSRIILSLAEVDIRRRNLLEQKGVLVSVGIRDFLGSRAQLLLTLTQDNINVQMASAGLKSVQVITISTTGNPRLQHTSLAESAVFAQKRTRFLVRNSSCNKIFVLF
jgi:hypothetical protein